jgi:uncharacterized membrane protein
MSRRLRLIPRIALFSALIYVLSWGTSFLPNVNLIFFIVFAAGFLWGAVPGCLVGAVGMGLWTAFNPFGPAALPIMLAQVVGAAAGGLVGAAYRHLTAKIVTRRHLVFALVVAAVTCTILYYLPVSVVDAWLFQPFWPRFIAGVAWAGISIAFNIVIFPLLFNVVRYLYSREGVD